MVNVFKRYARIYDIIYRDKDYLRESLFLKKVFRLYSKRQVKDVLDVACGTAGHAIELSKLGFSLYAQDGSKEMLEIAREKCIGRNFRVRFLGHMPMQKFRHKRKFDAAIAMFSSLDYLVKESDLRAALRNIHCCLKENGIFVFDYWNKECVLKDFTAFKKTQLKSGNERVLRTSRTVLDKKNDTAKINYLCDFLKGGRSLFKIRELHRMKYFSQETIKRFLINSGFTVLGCFPFMKIGKKVTPKTWNVSVIAKKIH